MYPVVFFDAMRVKIRDGLEILDVTLQRPNLESVFLHLTGRELRS
jgi:hypothetical protein